MKFNDLNAEVNRLTAIEAAEQVRRGALPQKPDEYKNELPKDFAPPQGVEFAFNAEDPLLSQAREFAQANGLSQESYSKMLGLYAGAQVADQASFKAAREAEINKLGPTGTARVTALTTFWRAFLGDEKAGDQMMARVLTAGDVGIHEKIVSRLSSQGAVPFSQQHRTAPASNGKIEGYDNMSFEQRRAAQDQSRRTAAR